MQEASLGAIHDHPFHRAVHSDNYPILVDISDPIVKASHQTT